MESVSFAKCISAGFLLYAQIVEFWQRIALLYLAEVQPDGRITLHSAYRNLMGVDFA
jgi:hypothetical protein